jgi:hypothetical protein
MIFSVCLSHHLLFAILTCIGNDKNKGEGVKVKGAAKERRGSDE